MTSGDIQIYGEKISSLVNYVQIMWRNNAKFLPHPLYCVTRFLPCSITIEECELMHVKFLEHI